MLEDEKGTSVRIWVSLTGTKLWWLDQSFKWAVSIKSVPRKVDQRPRLFDASEISLKRYSLRAMASSCHKNKHGSGMFEDLSNKSEVLIWPPHHPKLSPAETLWNVLDKQVWSKKELLLTSVVPDTTADQQRSSGVKSLIFAVLTTVDLLLRWWHWQKIYVCFGLVGFWFSTLSVHTCLRRHEENMFKEAGNSPGA